jgi:hypothetical protein
MVFVDITEASEANVPEREVADEANEALDTFLVPGLVTCLSSEGTDGFLNSPATGALIPVGRAATVLAPYFNDGIPCAGLSGLGVRDRVVREFPGRFLVAEPRNVPPILVFPDGV